MQHEYQQPPYVLALVSALLLSIPVAAAQSIAFGDGSTAIDFVGRGLANGGDGLGGACWIDSDEDGDLDLFLTNGKTHANGLFRNNGDGSFTDVATQAGVSNGLGNSSVIAGDIDNDGFKDLFLSGDGGINGTGNTRSRLYHNNGDGSFDEISALAGVQGQITGLAAAFADINNDGFLDLFVTGPGSLATNTQDTNMLFLNNGDLTFTNISATSGVNTSLGSCACFFSDYDNDGWIDIFVANCNDVQFTPTPIELFRNNRDLTFSEVGAAAGLSAGGFWMGLGPADYDNDGDIDFYATNVGGAANRCALYQNNGDGTYTNVALGAGAGLLKFGWGVSFKDYNNDGWDDVFYVGGLPGVELTNPGRLLFNNGDQTFTNISSQLPVNMSGFTSGVAAGDYDNDGFDDLVIVRSEVGSLSGRPFLLRNMESGNGNQWIRLRLQGVVSNRDAVGARVRVSLGALTQTKEIYAGSSFASMDSPWLTFGLGTQTRTQQIQVTWPSGLVEAFPNLDAGTQTTIIEGDGCQPAQVFCNSTPNSTGAAANISSNSICFVLENELQLSAGPIPGEMSLFFYSPGQANGGAGQPLGNGLLCVGGGLPIYRLPTLAPAGVPQMEQTIDLTQLPTGGAITAGSTWYFQAWFRDTAAGGAGFDFSDALGLTFLP